MSIYNLPDTYTNLPVQDFHEDISTFGSIPFLSIFQWIKDSFPKTPARPVRRGNFLSFAFTFSPPGVLPLRVYKMYRPMGKTMGGLNETWV